MIQIRGIGEGKATRLIEAANKNLEEADEIDETTKEVASDDSDAGDDQSTSDELPTPDVQEADEKDTGNDEDTPEEASSPDPSPLDDGEILK